MKSKTALREMIDIIERHHVLNPDVKEKLIELERLQLIQAYQMDSEIMKRQYRTSEDWYRMNYGNYKDDYMKKLTAVEWLIQTMVTYKFKYGDVTDRNSIMQQAKDMEKEQLYNAFMDSPYYKGYDVNVNEQHWKEYYQETYGGDK